MPRLARSPAVQGIRNLSAFSTSARTLTSTSSPLQADVQPTTGPPTGGAAAKEGRATLSAEQQRFLDSAVCLSIQTAPTWLTTLASSEPCRRASSYLDIHSSNSTDRTGSSALTASHEAYV